MWTVEIVVPGISVLWPSPSHPSFSKSFHLENENLAS